MDMSNWPAWVAGAVGVLAILRFYIVKPIIKVRDDMEEMTRVRSDITDIRHELQRNGGATVKDAVLRVEEQGVRLEAGMNQLKNRLDEHINFHLEEGRGK